MPLRLNKHLKYLKNKNMKNWINILFGTCQKDFPTDIKLES